MNKELGLKSANSLLILQTIDNNLFVFFESILIFTKSIFDIWIYKSLNFFAIHTFIYIIIIYINKK